MVDVLPGCEPLSATGAAGAVLVLHGFTGNPSSMRPLARRLADAGHAVELPRLPGHGTAIDDLVDKTWDDWSGAALAAYDELSARAGRAAVVGLSMGGGLTAHVAENRDVAGCVFINPLVKPVDASLIAMIDDALAQGTSVFDTGDASDIKRPGASEMDYGGWPLAALRSLMDGLVGVRARLAEITAPSLILTSREDHTVTTDNSDELADALAGPVERMWLEDSYHVATLDNDQERVEAETLAFVARVLT
ncbi:MAG TPA: alpha/beta fold hydrolase [Acidimicrobiales bacterium]|nr:alpha/beta fold hydrolase [Acidimicrobiales bacterium]